MFAFAVELFKALAAIPKIIDQVNAFAAGVAFWYVQRQEKAALAAIADAAAFAARAQSTEDRYNAAQKWKDALSRPRTTAQ